MNELFGVFDLPFAHRLGWALFHSLWEGTLAAGLFTIFRVMLRRHSSHARYVAGCVLLFMVAAAPALTLLAGHGGERLQRFGGSEYGASWSASEVPALPVYTVDYGVGPLRLFERTRNTLEGVFPWVLIGWLAGVSIFSCRLVRGAWWVRGVKKIGIEQLDEAWLLRLEELKRRLSISRSVRLLKSAVVEVPIVVGWLWPVLLLPASTFAGLTPAQLEAILAHELAHIRRWDYLVNAFQNLVETLMFYHPAVWWISNYIREEREHCCDDLVVRVCGNRVAYARALYTLETLREQPRLAFAASGGALLSRVRRLLGTAGNTRPAGARELGGLTLLGIGCLFALAGMVLMFQPSTYQARTIIRIRPDSALSNLPGEQPAFLAYYGREYMQTEMALLSSPAVLKRVPVNSGGEPPPADALALERLRSRLAVRQVRDTSLVEIVVSADRGPEAARLANAVATAYQQQRLEQHQRSSQGALEQLENRIDEQDAKIADAQEKLEKLRMELAIRVIGRDESSPSPTLSAETLRRVESLRLESKAELVRQETLLEKLRQLKPEELSQVLPTAVQDPLLSSLQERLNLAEQMLIGLSRDLGTEHPERVKAVAQIDDLQKKIRLRIDGILTGLETKAASTKQSLAQLDKEIAEAVALDEERANRDRPYWAAKRNLEELQRFRQVLAAKLTSERIDLQLPGNAAAEIVEEAAAPRMRVNPDRGRAAAFLGCGAFLAIIGIWLAKPRQPSGWYKKEAGVAASL